MLLSMTSQHGQQVKSLGIRSPTLSVVLAVSLCVALLPAVATGAEQPSCTAHPHAQVGMDPVPGGGTDRPSGPFSGCLPPCGKSSCIKFQKKVGDACTKKGETEENGTCKKVKGCCKCK